MPTFEDYRPSLDRKRKKNRAARGKAKRTPTEIGVRVPRTKAGWDRKAKAQRQAQTRRARASAAKRTGDRTTLRQARRSLSYLREQDRKDTPAPPSLTVTEEGRADIQVDDSVAKTASRDPFVSAVKNAPKYPSDAEYALMLLTGARGTALKNLGKAVLSARTARAGAAAQKSTAAAKAVAKRAPKKALKATPKAAPKTKVGAKTSRVKAKTKGRSKQAAGKVKARYTKPQRKMRRARRIERNVNATAAPIIPVAMTADERPRAFVEGHLKADPVKATATTLEAVPATFSFLGSAAGSAYRAAKTGDTGPLEGVARAGKEALQALEPLTSGDAEQVKNAVENDVGYVMAPLLPRGAVSTPVKALGKAATSAGVAVTRKARRIGPDRPPPTGAPGRLRHAGQVVGGRKARKRVAKLYARSVEPERRGGVRAAHEIERRARKSKGARSLRNLHGPEAGSAAVVLARYGVGRKNTLDRLEDVRRSLDESSVQYVNTSKTIQWLKANPKVLNDPKLWETVAELKKQTDEVATSPRATLLAQGRVAGVDPPEARVPIKARQYTQATTREGAHADLEQSGKKVKQLRKEAAKADQEAKVLRAEVRGLADKIGHAKVQRLHAAERASGDAKSKPLSEDLGRIEDLEADARGKLAEAKALSRRTKNLSRELGPFTKGDTPPSIRQRRPQWEKELVREYEADVRAQRHPDLEEPAWLSERDPGFQPLGGLGGPDIPSQGSRAVHIKTGHAEVADLAERSLPAALKSSVIGPRIQRGINRFVNRFHDEFGETVEVNGKQTRLVSASTWNKLVDEGKIDPRTHAPLPTRHFKSAVKSEGFDLREFHADMTTYLAGDMRRLDKTPGTKYAIYPREALREFSDQLNPNRTAFEAATSGIGTVATRIVLYSPAWLAAQFVNEGSQAVAAVGIRGASGAVFDLARLRRSDPDGYRALLHYSGDSAPAAQPVPPRLSMDASDYASYGDAARAARKTPVGRFLHDAARLRTFSNLDRWKSTRLRAIVQVAHANKELGVFTRGLSGMLRSQRQLSHKLKGMSRKQRHAYLARHPKELQRHLDYADDVMGNWDAFTRFERQFGPLTAFYSYIRMSFRWTFATYPKRHPVKASMLYLLAQQNRDELEKVLGREPTFLEGAMPVLYDEEGEPDAVFPAGQRFGAPGLNAIVESIGRENVTGVLRALNPAIGATLHGVTGLDPFTGEKVAESPVEIGLHTLNQLLSLSPAARTAELNQLGEGEKSEAAKAFAAIDPNRAIRSALNPFIPLSAERAKMQATLSRALEEVGNDPEFGELVQAILDGDRDNLKKLYEKVDLADDARDVLDRLLPSSPGEEDAVSKAGEILREGSPKRMRKARRRQRQREGTSQSIFGDTGYGEGGGLFKDTGYGDSSGGGLFKDTSSGGNLPDWARGRSGGLFK